MAQIFPIDFDEKLTIANNDFILFSDSEDGNKIKKAQYSNLKGEQGDPGTAATITVGSTTTGTPGSSASVVNSGTTSAAVLDFTIPEGEKGDTGDTGASVTSAAFNGNDIDFGLSDGTTVTLEDAKVDLKGDTGDAATISVGTTTTGNPGTNASVTNSGTSSAAVFNFTIPRGADGQDGQDGAAATISAGSASTLPAGSTPTVTNSGTSSAAVFNFGIPKGDTGATGNGIASVTTSKSGKVTTVTMNYTDGSTPTSFQVSDGADGEGAGDVVGPNSSTNGNVALFDGVTGKLIKDSGKAFTAAGIGALADSTKYGKTLDLSIDTTTYVVTATLKDQDGTTLSTDTIDLPLESVVVGGSYDSATKKVVLTLENGNTVEFSVADLVAGLQTEITSSNKLDADLVDDSTSTNKFVTSSDKTTWNGKQDALIAGTNITIAADGKTISATDTTYSAASSSTLGLVKLGDDTVQSVAANAVTGTASRTYAVQLNSSDQAVVNVPWTDTIQAIDDRLDTTSLNPVQNAVITNAINSKQATLSAGTGISLASNTVTNTGVITVNGNSGTVTVNDVKISSTAPSNPVQGTVWYDTANSLLKSYNGTAWSAVGAVLSVNGQTGAVTVRALPSGGTEGQILMIVSGTPTWVTPVNQGFIMQASGSPTAIKYIWAGTESQYSSATKNANTHYDTY